MTCVGQCMSMFDKLRKCDKLKKTFYVYRITLKQNNDDIHASRCVIRSLIHGHFMLLKCEGTAFVKFVFHHSLVRSSVAAAAAAASVAALFG